MNNLFHNSNEPKSFIFHTLNEFKIKKCEDFIENLLVLEDLIDSKDISEVMSNLHNSFLTLSNSFEISNKQDEQICLKINFKTFQEIVIDIDEKYSELAHLFVGKSKSEAASILKLYFDYEKRSCDFCGLYFHKVSLMTPVGRKSFEDFSLAFHPECC